MALSAIWALTLAAWLYRCVLAERHPDALALSIHATEYWEGIDGNWSTFWISVGSPQQYVRVLPGTSVSASTSTWLVLQQGCNVTNPDVFNCSSTRGSTFNANASSLWTTAGLPNRGLAELNTVQEGKLGLTGSVQYGFDTIELGRWETVSPSFEHQLISGITTNNYWLGFVGLSPYSTNITGLDHPIPSLLATLVNQGWIPSLSWGYTAGAYYHNTLGARTAYGSLTFGGYDANQWDPLTSLNDIPFSGDPSRDMVVQLTSLTKASVGNATLLTDTIDVYIDSTVTELWLPVDVCNNIQDALGLTYDEDAQLYFVAEDIRQQLKEDKTTLTIRIDSPNTLSLDFYFPYAAFDLVIQPPLVKKTARYFPLKRAEKPSQYTLGRVFLQEAYLVADYEAGNFGLGRATHWQPDNDNNQDLTALHSPAPSNVLAPSPTNGALYGGAIAGLVVGPLALLFLVFLAYILWHRRKRNRQRQTNYEAEVQARVLIPPPSYPDTINADRATAVELDSQARHELERNERMPELQGGRLAHQLDHRNERPSELQTGREAHEMGIENDAGLPDRSIE